jgi:hypothetical protein
VRYTDKLPVCSFILYRTRSHCFGAASCGVSLHRLSTMADGVPLVKSWCEDVAVAGMSVCSMEHRYVVNLCQMPC